MLTIEYAKNPVYVTEQNDEIDLIVKFIEIADELPFTATPFDIEPYGVELYNNAVAGQYGEVAPYVPPPKPPVVYTTQPTTTGTQVA
jgi:hypothetical protein